MSLAQSLTDLTLPRIHICLAEFSPLRLEHYTTTTTIDTPSLMINASVPPPVFLLRKPFLPFCWLPLRHLSFPPHLSECPLTAEQSARHGDPLTGNPSVFPSICPSAHPTVCPFLLACMESTETGIGRTERASLYRRVFSPKHPEGCDCCNSSNKRPRHPERSSASYVRMHLGTHVRVPGLYRTYGRVCVNVLFLYTVLLRR